MNTGSHHKMIIRLCLISLITLSAVQVWAQSINGRFYTSFYSWEREVFGEDPSKHFQTYSGAIVHVKKLGHKNLSFHTNVRFSKDLASNEFSLRNKLYNAYFEWKDLFNNKVDISFGRKFVWAGVGNGTIDGGKIEVSLNK